MNGVNGYSVIPMPSPNGPEHCRVEEEQASLYGSKHEPASDHRRPISFVNAKKTKTTKKYACKEHWMYWSVTRTVAALLLLLSSVNLDMFVLAVIHDRVPATPPLPDLIFDLLPKVDSALNISEVIIIVTTALMLSMVIVHRYSWIVLRRLMLIMSILYLFRGITMAVTQVPVANPQYYCSPKTNFTSGDFRLWPYIQTIFERVNHMSIGMGLSINGRHTFCGDYIFSGHTIIILLSKLCFNLKSFTLTTNLRHLVDYLMLSRYLFSSQRHLAWRLLHLACGLVVLAGVVCILISRGHYTIDIVIAVMMTSGIFYIYHAMVDTADSRGKQAEVVQRNWKAFWWYWVFDYFEHDILTHQVVFENRFRVPPIFGKLFRRLRRKSRLVMLPPKV